MSETKAIVSIASLKLVIGKQLLVEDLNLDLHPGECWCVLGKNGSGKTTLLSTLAGLQPATNGQITLSNKPLQNLSRKHIAKKIGLLFQEYPDSFPVTVAENVMAGRFPHMQAWQLASDHDLKCVNDALGFVHMTAFAGRMMNTLSGGEKRRAALATLVAQQPELYLLDEPANHLDVHFQATLLPALCSMVAKNNGTVFMSMHDINLAHHLTDKCLLLMGNGEYIQGNTHEMLTQKNLEALYNQRFEKVQTCTGTGWLPVLG